MSKGSAESLGVVSAMRRLLGANRRGPKVQEPSAELSDLELAALRSLPALRDIEGGAEAMRQRVKTMIRRDVTYGTATLNLQPTETHLILRLLEHKTLTEARQDLPDSIERYDDLAGHHIGEDKAKRLRDSAAETLAEWLRVVEPPRSLEELMEALMACAWTRQELREVDVAEARAASDQLDEMEALTSQELRRYLLDAVRALDPADPALLAAARSSSGESFTMRDGSVTQRFEVTPEDLRRQLLAGLEDTTSRAGPDALLDAARSPGAGALDEVVAVRTLTAIGLARLS